MTALKIVTCDRWNWLQIIGNKYCDLKKDFHHGPSDPGVQHVLMMLSDYMNIVGENAFPSQELLAARLRMSLRSVKRHLATAEAEGWIYRFGRPGRNPQAFVQHQYIATIPEALVSLIKTPPWELDPTWKSQKRRANGADKSQSKHGAKLAPTESPDLPKEPNMVPNLQGMVPNLHEVGAKTAESRCQIGKDMVPNWHPNSPSELSSDLSSYVSSELGRSKAAAPTPGENLDRESSKAEEPAPPPAAKPPTLRKVMKGKAEFSDLPKDQRERLALEVMAAVPTQALTWFAREYDLPIEDVERLKLSLSEAGALH